MFGANLSGAHLEGAYLEGAHLFGANFNKSFIYKTKLNNILLYEQDLPKFDEYIEKCEVKLIDPKIICVSEHEGYVYDPKTNRMIPPGDN